MANKAILYQQQIADDGGGWKYFAPMLHIDDDDLDPYEYRLLGHYRRVCGVNGGKCSESVETTAAKTKMSVGKVSQVRRRLCTLKRINLTEGGNNSIIVTLRDCWLENILRYTPSSDETSLHQVKADSDKPSSGEGSLHVVKQRTTSIEQPDNKQPEKQNTLRAPRADAPTSDVQETTHPAPIPTSAVETPSIPEAVSPAAPETPKPTEPKKPNLYEYAAGFAWANEGLGKAMLGQLLGTAKKGERAEYKLDTPATPEEIMGWHFWHKHKYGAEEWKKFLPRAAEKVKLSWDEFRADNRWYQVAVDRGASELEKQFAPPEPEVQRPQLSDEERAANVARYQQMLKEFSAKLYVDFSKEPQDKKAS